MTSIETSITKDFVLQIIQNKAWYGFNPETHAFNWQASLENIAASLNLNPQEVNQTITQAFTPDCLSQVIRKDNSSVSLLEATLEIGLMPHLWTVGDKDWQMEKFLRSGAANLIAKDHYHCSLDNKTQALEGIIKTLTQEGRDHIVVVDDKDTSLQSVKKLAQEYKARKVTIFDYLMKLSNPQADPTAFFDWLQGLRQKVTNNQIGLIFDFDGVVANTDQVLFGQAVDNLYNLLHSRLCI